MKKIILVSTVLIALMLIACGTTAVESNTGNEDNIQNLTPTILIKIDDMINAIDDADSVSPKPTIKQEPVTDTSSDTAAADKINDNPDKILIYRLGEITIKGKTEEYELLYYKRAERDYYLEVRVSGSVVINYPLEDDFAPETVGIHRMERCHNTGGECKVLDLNGDGNEDFFIDLGINGKNILRTCFVFDEVSDSFLHVDRFDGGLSMAEIYGECIMEWYYSMGTQVRRKYVIEGNKLKETASLSYAFITYIDDENLEVPAGTFTEKELINGEMVTVKDRVRKKDIDLDKWGIEESLDTVYDVSHITPRPTIAQESVTAAPPAASAVDRINGKSDKLVIYRLGKITIKGKTEEYEILYYKRAERDYYLEVRISGSVVINYPLRDDFAPETVGIYPMLDNRGAECKEQDFNGDGNDDLFIDLGVSGHRILRTCFVFDEMSDSFLPVDGVDELSMPKMSNGGIIEQYNSQSGYTEVRKKYVVEGNKLKHTASLLYASNAFTNDENLEVPAKTYTEIELINGEMVIVKDRVKEENMDGWGY